MFGKLSKEIDAERARVVVPYRKDFTADDVLCVALLLNYYGEEYLDLVRSSNPVDFETADYVINVGGRKEVERFPYYKVWADGSNDHSIAADYIFDNLLANGMIDLILYMHKDLAEKFRSIVISPIAAADVNPETTKYPNLFTWVNVFSPSENICSDGNSEFEEAVELALRIIEKVIMELKANA